MYRLEGSKKKVAIKVSCGKNLSILRRTQRKEKLEWNGGVVINKWRGGVKNTLSRLLEFQRQLYRKIFARLQHFDAQGWNLHFYYRLLILERLRRKKRGVFQGFLRTSRSFKNAISWKKTIYEMEIFNSFSSQINWMRRNRFEFININMIINNLNIDVFQIICLGIG